MVSACELIADGTAVRIPQNEEDASYDPMWTKVTNPYGVGLIRPDGLHAQQRLTTSGLRLCFSVPHLKLASFMYVCA